MKPFLANHAFLFFQVLFLGVLLGWLYLRRSGSTKHSQFAYREAERKDRNRNLGQRAQPSPSEGPLLLPGIPLDGKPHEVLGVSIQASEKEVQEAYRALMKRFHPDKMGPPGTQRWKDAQHIAEAINRARSSLLDSLRKQKNSP